MNRAKSDRLKAAGWAVSDTRELLSLSDAEAMLVEIRVELAVVLRNARRAHKWTQAEFADAIGSSQSRVAKMESGDASVSIDLLVRSLLASGSSGARIGAAFASADRNSRARRTSR